jgi:hypothetical protein
MIQEGRLVWLTSIDALVPLPDRGVEVPREVEARSRIRRIKIDRIGILSAVTEERICILHKRTHPRQSEKSAQIDPLRQVNFQIRLNTSASAAALARPGIKGRITKVLVRWARSDSQLQRRRTIHFVQPCRSLLVVSMVSQKLLVSLLRVYEHTLKLAIDIQLHPCCISCLVSKHSRGEPMRHPREPLVQRIGPAILQA